SLENPASPKLSLIEFKPSSASTHLYYLIRIFKELFA
ncbi:MAG: hypothetical protein ACI85S_002102, partial [Pseudohongiellaceae bacterium]